MCFYFLYFNSFNRHHWSLSVYVISPDRINGDVKAITHVNLLFNLRYFYNIRCALWVHLKYSHCSWNAASELINIHVTHFRWSTDLAGTESTINYLSRADIRYLIICADYFAMQVCMQFAPVIIHLHLIILKRCPISSGFQSNSPTPASRDFI